jgi:hypothetical protein
MTPNNGAAGNSRCPCQLRLILWNLFVIIPFNPALRDSAAVPELWTLGHMTAKQRYWWIAVVVVFIFCPIYAIALSPYSWGMLSCLVSSPVLLISGIILVVRHKTFLGLIPIIFALCFAFSFFVIPTTYH